MNIALKFCKELAKEQGIKLFFKKLNECSAFYDDETKEIFIDSKGLGLNTQISAVFHELGHVHCIKNGLWKKYHSDPPDMRTALRAEVWIENWAEKEFKKYFPNGYYGPYDRFYRYDETSRNFLKQYNEQYMPKKKNTKKYKNRKNCD